MSNKVYVDVLAEFSKDGLLIPKEITWEDGRKYEITRVKDNNPEKPVWAAFSQYKGRRSWRALYLCDRWKGNIPFL